MNFFSLGEKFSLRLDSFKTKSVKAFIGKVQGYLINESCEDPQVFHGTTFNIRFGGNFPRTIGIFVLDRNIVVIFHELSF
jgi:hypothetical protein